MTTDLKFRWAEEVLGSELHDTTKLVGMDLWTYADKSGENAHPGNKRIADRLNKAVRTVKSHMAILRDGGWIVRTSESNHSQTRQWADTYRLQIPPDRVQPETDRVQRGTLSGATWVAPQQVCINPLQNSDPSGSGPAKPDARPCPSDWKENHDAAIQWLDFLLSLDNEETTNAGHYLANEVHPKAILNFILKNRRR